MVSERSLNLGFACHVASDTDRADALLVKVYKSKGDEAALCPKDDEREAHNWLRLNSHGFGVPLLARYRYAYSYP